MTHIKQIIYWLPVLALALSACTREVLVENSSDIIEGEKATLYLRVNAPEMKVHSRAALTKRKSSRSVSSYSTTLPEH
jgi:hypothetical protein